MPSATARRLVKPSYWHAPEWVETYGPEVAELNAHADFPPDPEQELLLDVTFGIRVDGLSAAGDITVIAARQTIKTGFLQMCATGWLYVVPQPLIVWSAHETDATDESHRELAHRIERVPALSKRLKLGPSHGITYSPGKQLIELRTGERLKFKARTTSGGRALTGYKTILDEMFAAKPEHMGAILPAMNAVPDPQLLGASSAGKITSAVLRAIRNRGRNKLGNRSAYAEWGVPRVPCESGDACTHLWPVAKGCSLDRRDLWEAAITTYGTRTNEEKIQWFRENMPPEEFAREFLVWWDDPGGSGPWPEGTWERCGEDEIDVDGVAISQITGQVHVAIDVAWGRKSGALAVGGLRDDGRTQVELVDENRPGIGWLVDRAAEVARKHGAPGVILDPASAAGALKRDLERTGVEVIEVTGRAYKQACGNFYDGVIDRDIVHLNQLRLSTAVEGAEIGPTGAWKPGSGGDISPLCAVTLVADGVGALGGSAFFSPDDLYDDPEDQADDESEEDS